MVTRRSRLEIYLDILKVINEGVDKPTRIMYATNLSWTPLSNILESLKDQGLIVIPNKGSRNRYEITEKGKNVVKYLSQAIETVKIEHGKTRVDQKSASSYFNQKNDASAD